MRSRQMIGVEPLQPGIGDFPDDVFFGGPFNGQVLFVADAVESWPTPLRPVVGAGRQQSDKQKSHDSEIRFQS